MGNLFVVFIFTQLKRSVTSGNSHRSLCKGGQEVSIVMRSCRLRRPLKKRKRWMFSAISNQTGAVSAGLRSCRSSRHKLPSENNSSATAAKRHVNENISLTKYWTDNAPISKSEEWSAGTSVSVTQYCGRMSDIHTVKGNKSCETWVSSEGDRSDNWWSRCSQTADRYSILIYYIP